LKLLDECAKQGEWLCLKNLHLVTAWLPTLEKVINSLQPHEKFRLWLTAESHPKFPAILLQSSLKITYEAPPGIKKNMQRTYENWTPEFIAQSNSVARSQSLFALSWFHALVQERRNYVPQGFTKFYEFSSADMRAGADIINRLFMKSGGGSVHWDFVHGLFENAIYGGRVDNNFDVRVLNSYLKQYFADGLFSGQGLSRGTKQRKLADILTLPSSTNYKEFTGVVASLPDEDMPSFFGLPANIERSSQRIISTQVISQLKVLMRSDEAAKKFNKEKWNAECAPILNLWKRLNQGHQVLQKKLSPPQEDENSLPVTSFIILELYNAVNLAQHIHSTLASLAKVIKGTQLLTTDVEILAIALMRQQVPADWSSRWDSGPEDPVQWLTALMSKTLALTSWAERAESGKLLSSTLDLSDLFHPDTFLNALRQQTARSAKIPMDKLKLSCTWKEDKVTGAKHKVKIEGLQLEGCTFDGTKLHENLRDSPSISSVPVCTLAWLPKENPDPYPLDECLAVPLYYTLFRDRIVTQLNIPCGKEQDKWIQCGAALFLKNV